MVVTTPDPVQVKVASILLAGAARAYDYPRSRPVDEGFDPELCHHCQRVNSVLDNLCEACHAQ